MEKLILAAFLSSLAGFITAVLSIVKLVNEKENRTSEFRQDWTNSLRACTARLISKSTALTASTEIQRRLMTLEAKLAASTKASSHEKRLELIRSKILRVGEELAENRNELAEQAALFKLHFKPDEPGLKPIDLLFETIREINTKIDKESDVEKRHQLRKENHKNAQDIIPLVQATLKCEWERVKKGEDVYKRTKNWSLGVGVLMLVVLLITGGFTAYLNTKSIQADSDRNGHELECWQLQSAKDLVVKFNTCTGEIVKVATKSLK